MPAGADEAQWQAAISRGRRLEQLLAREDGLAQQEQEQEQQHQEQQQQEQHQIQHQHQQQHDVLLTPGAYFRTAAAPSSEPRLPAAQYQQQHQQQQHHAPYFSGPAGYGPGGAWR